MISVSSSFNASLVIHTALACRWSTIACFDVSYQIVLRFYSYRRGRDQARLPVVKQALPGYWSALCHPNCELALALTILGALVSLLIRKSIFDRKHVTEHILEEKRTSSLKDTSSSDESV